jgi:hypothetical protein
MFGGFRDFCGASQRVRAGPNGRGQSESNLARTLVGKPPVAGHQWHAAGSDTWGS